MNLFVRSAGFLTSVQDLGRVGQCRSGVSVGGALDWHAMRVANVLVGNEVTAAGLEATMGNLRLRFEDQRLVAWCGGAFAVRIGDTNFPPGRVGLVSRDEELVMTAPKNGARAWLAIAGGINVPPVLESRSTDLRAGFGGYEGRPLRDGDSLPLGNAFQLSTQLANMFRRGKIAPWSAPSAWSATPRTSRVLRFVPGEHWSRFSPDAHAVLASVAFSVTADSDRMGARLDGPLLSQLDATELQSEAVAPGTIQVPPNGQPIALLGDCQTVGGYPRIAHVITVDFPVAAQLWPGNEVRFYEVSLAEAQRLLREREEDFAYFRAGIGLQLR